MIERYSRPRMKAVWSEKNKYDKWLEIELATCEAWTEEGVVPRGDMDRLRGVTYNPERLDEILQDTRHEMTAFLSSITESIGPEGRWLHLGLTTSDVWDTGTGILLREAADLLDAEIDGLLEALRTRAIEHKHTLIMGRTHGVHAEPTTFGLKLALWYDEMQRNKERIAQARKGISVGKLSGPVGTHATVPPAVEARVCRRLGVETAPVSNQVVQRDRHAQFVATLAIIAASLEKFATEIRALQRTEVREVAEYFPEGQPGSSSMPHKRNPELSERVCGLARLVRGHTVTALENVAIAAMVAGAPRVAAEARARELLVNVGLEARLTHRPPKLSGGERQRVALARALVNDPRVVLADEPTGNLDRKTSEAVHDLIWDLRERLGQTFVIVTHNAGLAQRSDRTVELVDGRIAAAV